MTFEAHEIKEVVLSMHPDKSLGPDGLNPRFYQAYWDIIGDQVTTACLQALNNDIFSLIAMKRV